MKEKRMAKIEKKVEKKKKVENNFAFEGEKALNH